MIINIDIDCHDTTTAGNKVYVVNNQLCTIQQCATNVEYYWIKNKKSQRSLPVKDIALVKQ